MSLQGGKETCRYVLAGLNGEWTITWRDGGVALAWLMGISDISFDISFVWSYGCKRFNRIINSEA